ncbi:MAG: hypothetical protein AB1349_02855 [Elusimicrobiota bacterium]
MNFEILILIFLFCICSCATKRDIKIGEEGFQERGKVKNERVIWSSHNKRPEWTIKEPYEKNTDLLFVGISNKFATEKEARDDAQNTAIKTVVKYIGVDVKNQFQQIRTSYGLSSDIVDPTIATREIEQQLSQAVARKVKAVEWYIEKIKVEYEKQDKQYYSVFLLAKIPKNEIDDAIKKQIEEQKEKHAKIKEVKNLVNNAQNLIIDAKQVIQTKPGKARNIFNEAIKILEQVKIQISEFPEAQDLLKQIASCVLEAKANINKAEKILETKIIVCMKTNDLALLKYIKMIETEISNTLNQSMSKKDIVLSSTIEENEKNIDFKEIAGTLISGDFSCEYMDDKVLIPGGSEVAGMPCSKAEMSIQIIDVINNKTISDFNVSGKGFGRTKEESQLKALKEVAINATKNISTKIIEDNLKK